ncbi:MAG: FAD-dependent oxidoreductase [Candidatus Thermoplasmatota archaeon]|nr:FAD-dependent oxidoreductase [Candidatus Thermoplasmatota archaeon]
MYDILVIGTGPAGYTSALYSARYNLDVIQVGEMPGGLISEAPEVCNYPGFDSISGMELGDRMEEQVKDIGAEVVYDKVEKIEGDDQDFTVKTSRDEYRAKKVILATGQERRRLGLERENEFKGKGVSYCATCDAAFYEDKRVGIVGGGDAALASALLLSDHAEKVYILYRREEFFRPEPIRVEEIEQEEKIKPVFEVNVKRLIGEDKLEAVELDNSETLEVDGLFIEIGSTPNSDLAEDIGVELSEGGYVKTDEDRRTNIPGVFAAGDVIDSPLKQAITAAGQGAEAASTAYEDLKKEEVR